MNAKYTMGRSWIIILFIAPVCWSDEVQIIEPRVLSDGIKMNAEVELSLFTEELGFVDDEYIQYGTPWHRLLKQYVTFTKMRSALLAYDTKITKRYFGENFNRNERLCKAYLNNETFNHNGIWYTSPTMYNPIRYLQKPIRLQYFWRAQDQMIKVISCPIVWGSNGQTTSLFFQEIWTRTHFTQERWYRGYYTFANSPVFVNNMQPMELLTFTQANADQLPRAPDPSGEECPGVKDKQRQMSDAPRIHLYSPPGSSKLRLFGRAAELHFWMKTYGFVDIARSLWKSARLLSFLDQMKEGYELNQQKLSGTITKNSNAAICKKYIENNDALSQYDIHFRQELNTDISWMAKLVKFRVTKISKLGRYYNLLRCPINGYKDKYYLYIFPVYYLNPNKQTHLFTFFEPYGNENEDDEGEEEENEYDEGEVNVVEVYDSRIYPDEVIPFMLSATNPKQPHQRRARASTSSLPDNFQRLGIEDWHTDYNRDDYPAYDVRNRLP